MLTNDEIRFIHYWEKNREKKSRFWSQLTGGLPMGLIFSLPILLAVIFHNWYKSMIYISNAQLILIAIVVFFIAIFYAIFRMRFLWERNEQLYKELKSKQSKDNAAHY